MEFVLVILGLIAVVVGPLLAISAYARVQRLESGRFDELDALTHRVEQLERRLGRAPEAEARASTVAPLAPPAAAPPEPITGPPAAPPRARRPSLDLEALIAGRWLNRVGLLLVFLAAFFALKWEFDNNVLGPAGRVALWTVLGTGLLGYAQWLAPRGYRYLSEGLTGLGGAVLYLTLYFGWQYYKLFPQAAAFVAMVFVTGALVALAVGRDSQRIALLALIGGLLTPLLTSTGQDAQFVLFSYLLILDSGLLVLARARQWRGLEPLAFFGTVTFFWGWYDTFYQATQPLAHTAAFATLFYAVFTALPVVRSRSTGRLFPEQALVAVLNAGNYLAALHALLWPERRWTLTIAVLILAALHLAATAGIPRRSGEQPVARTLFAGLALTFVALAIPIRLDGAWITLGWALEGAVLVWSGFALRWWFLRASGLALYAVAIVRLLLLQPHADTFVFNPRLATFAVVIAACVVALERWRAHPELLNQRERPMFAALGVSVNVLAVWALSLEANQYFAPLLTGDHAAVHRALLGRQLALSLLWTVYATALVVGGVRAGMAGLRWQGLALFALVVGKVFLYDLSFLSGGYRVLSSIILGIMLIAVSVLYQRRVAAHKVGAGP